MPEHTESLLEYWQHHLHEDLGGFADPLTEVLVVPEGNELIANWEQRGQTRSERFRLSQTGDFRWLNADHQPQPYRDFLSGYAMAEFAQVAAAMCRRFVARDDFVATDATVVLADGDELKVEASPQALRDEVITARRALQGRTSLFFVKGDAGAGKTTLLRELTAAQARKFAARDASFLFFYVSAQGRSLSNLRDAFSGELQDLRAGFTRDAVPALAREGLLVPVIDGFDELLGAAGYGDAFSSLRQFLTELHGRGTVLVSARSAFYNLEFINRAPEVIDAELSLQPITLLPWDDEKLNRYLSYRQQGANSLRGRAVELNTSDRALLSKPFFASEFPGYAAALAGSPQRSTSLLDYLIDAYIERETSKTLGASGEPLLSKDGHRQLLEEAANEMWHGEKRQLSMDELRTLVELVAEDEGRGGDEARQLITRVTSAAGLRTPTGQGAGQFTFDHEVYFDYFLSKSLERQFHRPDGLGLFFDRGVLPTSVVVEATLHESSPGFIDLVCGTGSSALRHENRRRNIGACIVAYSQHYGPVTKTTIRNAAFIDLAFGNAMFEDVTFDNCEFTGSRFEAARFLHCDASTSRFHSVVVTNDCSLDVAGLVPGANVGSVIHPDVSDEVFSPKEVGDILRRLGAPLGGAEEPQVVYSPRAQVLIQLLQIMARTYRRANVLFESDEFLTKLFSNSHWPELRKLLTTQGVVREEPRAVAGPRVLTYRLLVGLDALVSSENVVDLPPGAIGDFWAALRGL